MKLLRRIWNRLAGSLGAGRSESELADEFESHVRLLTDDNIRRGMPADEARRAALVTFGGIEPAKEIFRDQRGFPLFAALRQDLTYALRGMRRSPGFTAAAVGCLALGIGANTAIFSIVNAVMLRSLPVSHPEQLQLVNYTSQTYPENMRRTGSGYGPTSLPYPAWQAFRRNSSTLSGVSGVLAFAPLGFNNRSVSVSNGGTPSVAGGEMVSGNYFEVLGVTPFAGRAIQDDDLEPSAPNAVVLSYSYWSRQFGAETSVLGRTIGINGVPFTVVGIAPRGFFGVDPGLSSDLWIPLRDMHDLKPWSIQSSGENGMFQNPHWWWCMMIARLKPGTSVNQASSQLEVIFHQVVLDGISKQPKAEQIPHIELTAANRGLDHLEETFKRPIRVLLVAVALVLLIACANVATLLLARSRSRQKEMSVRLAIGASRSRLIRQFLTESLLLSVCGGAAGLLFASWGSRVLLVLMSGNSHALAVDVAPDASILAFTAAVALVTALLFGLAPAFRATHVDLAHHLKEKSASAPARATFGRVLIAAQIALSVCLLFGAGLFVRTLQKLQDQDYGFNRQRILIFELDPRRGGNSEQRVLDIYRQSLESIQAMPGVRSASLSGLALLSGWVNNSSAFTEAAPAPNEHSPSVFWNLVGPDFFETMSIPVVLGHSIGWHDMTGRRVAAVNESFARRLFPGASPLGRSFSFGDSYDPAKAYEIVGVVRNAKYGAVRDDPPPTAYIPYTARAGDVGRMTFEVRAAGDPLALTAALRETMRRVDPNLPLIGMKTQEELLGQALAREIMFARITTFFGFLALVLVAVGVYGTLAYGVTRRTGEIGIRIALGAARSQILWMVLRESLLLVACGVAVGLPIALLLTRYIASMLFNVKANDAATIVVTVLVLAASGALAGFIPARRASRISPIRALHYE
jgi:predicted permease